MAKQGKHEVAGSGEGLLDMRGFFRYSFARHGAGPAFRWLIAGCALVGVAAAQQSSATLHNMAGIADAPRPSLLLGQTPVSSPAANPQDGRLYLSLQEAFRMALKNNLDIEVEQVDQTIADLSVPLTEGGGLPRAINYTVADTPAGEAAVAVPLLSFSSPGLSPLSVDPITSTVSSSYNTSHIGEGAHSLSLSGSPYSLGTPVPGFDAVLLGRYGWLRRNPAISLTSAGASATPANTVTTDNTLGDTILTKGFGPGTKIQLGVNDFVQSFYSGRSSAVPFSHPNAFALIAQPLLRGAGHGVNTRYIAIAKTNKKISAAVLEQQMISTIAGVKNLYVDLVSLQDSVKVQQQALSAAELLLNNDREQLEVGRLPPIEVARAESLVTSTQLMLTQVVALRDQQEVILRTLLDPQSLTRRGCQCGRDRGDRPARAAAGGDGGATAGTGETRVGNTARCAAGTVAGDQWRAAGRGFGECGEAGSRCIWHISAPWCGDPGIDRNCGDPLTGNASSTLFRRVGLGHRLCMKPESSSSCRCRTV